MLDETHTINRNKNIIVEGVNCGNRINNAHADATVKKVNISRVAGPTARVVARAPITNRRVSLLPPLESLRQRPTLTVVFDLDETLVSNRHPHLPQAILRPYALHVLNAMRQMEGLEIVLWTASTSETAAPVLRQLQSRGAVFDEVICRNDTWFTDPIHTKDLRLLGRDMDRVVIFDNAVGCLKLNPGNAVLVEDFTGREDPHDRHDAALVNTYYITDNLRQGVLQGIRVRDSLDRMVVDRQLCEMVSYALPTEWTKVNLNDYAPLKVPPHGNYVRAYLETAAPLEHWTMGQ